MPNKFIPPQTTTTTRTAATPLDGEILYDTDEKKLYYGDGTTVGGKAVGGGSYNDLSDKPALGTAAALDVGTTANKVIQLDNTGKLPAVDGSQLTGITGSGGGHTIQDEGVDLTQRSKLNFVGGGVEVTDNLGTDTTTVTITGAAGNTFPDNVFRVQDNTDSTKQLAFETSGITTGTTRTLTVPDSNGTIRIYTTTLVKTSNYTANNYERIPCDTSGGGFTITPPSSGFFQVIDVVGNSPTTGFGATSKNLTVTPASGTIMGDTSLVLDTGGISPEFELIGTDWRIVNHG